MNNKVKIYGDIINTWKAFDEDIPPKSIKGTVKEHKVYRDVKQTELTRCKVNGKVI